jgi:hypothetical protein
VAECRYAECRSATKTFVLKSVGRISFSLNIMVTLCWSEPVMLPSIEGTGAELGEGMLAIDLRPNDIRPNVAATTFGEKER